LQPSQKPPRTDETLPFRARTFSDKNRHVHRHMSSVPIISYGRISPSLAINPHGDKTLGG